MAKKIGLVLTGGGARGAYQAGALLGIADLCPEHKNIFPIITGISAGCINAAFIACHNASFHHSSQRLWDIWANLETKKVYKQSKTGFASVAMKAMLNIFLGNIFNVRFPSELLDNSPLNLLIQETIDVEAIDICIKKQQLIGVSFSAMDFNTNTLTSFFEAASGVSAWQKNDSIGVRTKLTHQHVMASSAIPGIFRLEKIGCNYFGDGSSKVTYPLAPAIHLGAEKIFAIDMRCENNTEQSYKVAPDERPQIGEIFASLLDAIFSDSLDRDVERLDIINQLIVNTSQNHKKWRPVPYLLLRPSQDLGFIAQKTYPQFSADAKKTMHILGQSHSSNMGLISHLAFEKPYMSKLLELGRSDVYAKKDEIKAFLEL